MGARYDSHGKFIGVESDPDYGKRSAKFGERQFDDQGNHLPSQAGEEPSLRDNDQFETRSHGPTSIGTNHTNELPGQAGTKQNHTKNLPVRTIDRDRSYDPMTDNAGRRIEGGEYQAKPLQPGGGSVVPKGGVTVEEDHANGGFGVSPGGDYKTTRRPNAVKPRTKVNE